MLVAITGATGLIGSAVAKSLRQDGDQVIRLVRHQPEADDQVQWDPQGGTVDTAGLAGVDAVLHLAGENIAGRWTESKKRRIRESRVVGTRTLVTALATMTSRPQTLVSMSATGIYGSDNGDKVLDESSPPGESFLAEVAVEWEAAAQPAAQAGMRVVHPRLSMVLSTEGGALQAMLPAFKVGLGGVVGSGDQYWSWVALPDVVDVLKMMLRDDRAHGPINLTSPNPVTNRTFTQTLGRELRRPTVLPVPVFGAKLIFAEMADELLLASARVVPSKLDDLGYRFQLPELAPALHAVLNDS